MEAHALTVNFWLILLEESPVEVVVRLWFNALNGAGRTTDDRERAVMQESLF